MDVLGFAFIKLHGSRNKLFEVPFHVDTNIQFKEIEKGKSEAVKDKDFFSVLFNCEISYHHTPQDKKDSKAKEKQSEIILEGYVTLSLTKEESKELQKLWKKQEVPENLREPLFNLILRKCTVRALTIEDELGIPPHLSLPRVKFQSPTQ